MNLFISDSLFYLSLIKASWGRDESLGTLLGLGTLSLVPAMAMLVKNGGPQETFGKARRSYWRGHPRGQGACEHPPLQRLFVLL